jgi:hypothetical protein
MSGLQYVIKQRPHQGHDEIDDNCAGNEIGVYVLLQKNVAQNGGDGVISQS